MNAWSWLYSGIGLIILELVAPGFVMMFFGFGALLVALLAAVLPAEWFTAAAQWVSFGVFSLASLLLLRKCVRNVFAGAGDKSSALPDAFVGKSACVVEEITRRAPGKVEFNGSNWKAELAEHDADPIPPGAIVEIVKHDNLTLFVKAK